LGELAICGVAYQTRHTLVWNWLWLRALVYYHFSSALTVALQNMILAVSSLRLVEKLGFARWRRVQISGVTEKTTGTRKPGLVTRSITR
jgi:hypothetical protein